MKSSVRLKLLVEELNKTDELLNARGWAKRSLCTPISTSDVLLVQTHLNVLCLLGLVKRTAQFHGKSPRYLYKRYVNSIKLEDYI